MSTNDLFTAASGALFLAYGVIALYFWTFWRRTRERLFASFAVAFLLLAAERLILLWIGPNRGEVPQVYLTRLAAFVTLAWAIWDKNRRER